MKYVVIVLATLLFSVSVWADTASIQNSAVLYSRANFVQEKHSAILKNPVISKGYMSKEGNGFKIVYSEPFRYSYEYDGENLIQTSLDMNVAKKIKIADSPGMAVAMGYFKKIISQEFAELDQVFKITGKDGKITMKPLNSKVADILNLIELETSNKLIQKISVNFKNGDRTVYSIISYE